MGASSARPGSRSRCSLATPPAARKRAWTARGTTGPSGRIARRLAARASDGAAAMSPCRPVIVVHRPRAPHRTPRFARVALQARFVETEIASCRIGTSGLIAVARARALGSETGSWSSTTPGVVPLASIRRSRRSRPATQARTSPSHRAAWCQHRTAPWAIGAAGASARSLVAVATASGHVVSRLRRTTVTRAQPRRCGRPSLVQNKFARIRRAPTASGALGAIGASAASAAASAPAVEASSVCRTTVASGARKGMLWK
mmetsp:Transcript_169795/g.544933  ORF Transcript_169795/g.544933 Transcript_169795/m.544933 type:complete len:259 (-) Transcript_169795:2855-3631(-)